MKRWRSRAAWLLVSMLVAGLLAGIQAGAQPALRQGAPVAGPEHVRGLEQTLLTYPEWYLVFSPAEYAQYTAAHPPSGFPWYGHIGQFWHGYAEVTEETVRRELDFNPGYHLMIMVIGISTTVEYALHSAYEMLVGRLSEALAGKPTAEDAYAARVAQEYVDFIRVQPWYEFDFAARLRGLWQETGYDGPDSLRKWERKFALSTEYGIKMLYGQLIKRGTRSVYDEAAPVTAVVTRTVPAADARLPALKRLLTLPDGRALLTVPRYAAFTTYARALAAHGMNFEEIAGNRSFILVSLHTPRDWTPPLEAPALLRQPILTRPAQQRVVLIVPVNALATQLRQWQAAGLQVEHIFDY